MMDFVLEAWVSGIIEMAQLKWMLGAGVTWKPGEKLRLLFPSYNGTRNTGADVRVEEILRQVRRILGEQNISLSVMTYNPEFTRGYFGDAAAGATADALPPVPFERSAEISRRGRRRRLDVQKQIRERLDCHDDRLARHRRRPE